jgi:hypothetical protein
MFVLGKYKSAWVPVTLKGLDEAGEPIEQGFELCVKLQGRDVLTQWLDQIQAAALKDEPFADVLASEVELVVKYVTDWKGVALEDGAAAPFNAANLQKVLNVPNMPKIIQVAIMDAQKGEAETRRKNLKQPDGSGPSADGQDIARTV